MPVRLLDMPQIRGWDCWTSVVDQTIKIVPKGAAMKSSKVPVFMQFASASDAMHWVCLNVPAGGRGAYHPVELDNGKWTVRAN